MADRPVVLSIQSAVARGHVGNRAAVPALEALGIEVWPIDTVSFSNHPGHGGFRGRVREAGEVREIVAGLVERGWLGTCTAVLSGYLGAPETAAAVVDAVTAGRSANPRLLYCCDPVIGDHGRVFVREGVETMIAERLLPLADIATPNAFELGRLAGRPVASRDEALLAARMLARRLRPEGLRAVLATGIVEANRVHTIYVGADGAWSVDVDWIDRPFNGTGDLLAALFLGWRVREEAPERALARAVAGVAQVLDTTLRTGRDELALTASLRALADPPQALVARLPDQL
jgi:pyridoxine kinase